MENFENEVQGENSLISNDEINTYLMETSKWGKFLAIVGFIGIGLLVLIAIFAFSALSKLNNLPGMPLPIGFFAFFYIVLAAIYFFPTYYLFKFSVQIKQGLVSKDVTSITSGFQNLKSLFKFMGILTVIALSIYGLVLLFAIPMIMLFFKS